MSMATLFPEACAGREPGRRLALAVAAGAAMALLTGASGTYVGGVGKDPVNWAARSSDVDYKSRVMHLHGEVKISQGEMSVAADDAVATAAGEDSRNSHWEFTGNVQIRAQRQGELHADRASVEITDGALASATVTGTPAQFEQTRAASGKLVKGHAASISYDVAAATIRLSGDACLSDEHNQDMRGSLITYNMRERRIEANSNAAPGARVEMTFDPKGEPGAATRANHDCNALLGKP